MAKSRGLPEYNREALAKATASASAPDYDLPEALRSELRAAGLRAEAARNAPPEITWGESTETLVLDDGKVLIHTARRGWGGSSAFIDWLNFTCHETSFEWFELDKSGKRVCLTETPVTDDQLMIECSAVCERIFGFGITEQRKSGANFYKRSYVLGNGFGMVCHGGNRSTILVSLSGTGIAAAKRGWEKRLYDWFNTRAVSPRISRVDCAHDDFTGETYSVDRADSDYTAELFTSFGRTPDCEHRGNWKRPNGKGRTFYVGHRTNGKYARIYEKGKQLGSSSSNWCRIEVEFKSVDRFIPFEILLEPGKFLAAAYPAFNWISEHQERILTEQKSAQITYDKMLDWLKRQCGAAFWAASHIEGGAENLLQKIQREVLPPRLIVPDYRDCREFFHNFKRAGLPASVVIEQSFAC